MDRPNGTRALVVILFAISVADCTPNAASIRPSSSPEGASAAASVGPSATPQASLPASPAPSATAPVHNPAAYVEGQAYAPAIDAAAFVAVVDNPYFPLTPGTTYVFEGGGEHNEVAITHETKAVFGVTAVVVHDQVFVGGALKEDTLDWYAQDRWGNVWYMGEATGTVENGKVTSTKGSWEAGVDGALPGIVMLADPRVGDAYRQEFYQGRAEDLGMVLEVNASATVTFDAYANVVITRDSSVIESTVEEKAYAPGVGFILERNGVGGQITLQLVEIKTGG